MHSPENTEVSAVAAENLQKVSTFAISLLQQQNLEDLLWSIVEHVGELLGYEDCVIYLRKENTLVQAASYLAGSERRHWREFRLHIGSGVVGRVAETGKAKIVRDTRQELDYVADDFSGLSELAVPIVFEGRVLGVLDSESQEANAYSDEDCELLQVLANIAASRMASAMAETERRQLVEVLEDKNEELERVIYTVSHDLKSPLVTVQGFLDLLEKDIASGNAERLQSDIERIREAAMHMERLLDDLLHLSRVGRLLNPFEDVDLGDLAHEAIRLGAGRIQERGVDVAVLGELPMVSGDRQQLFEVFQNLIDNGVKFMGPQPNPRIAIFSRQEGEEVTCSVQDNGIGLDPSNHSKIFDLFDRVDPNVEGTGIGLALVKRVVELHGGRVWVESAGYGRGSTFSFSLPRRDVEPASATR